MQWLLILLLVVTGSCLAKDVRVRTLGPQKPVDISHDFFKTVLSNSLARAYPGQNIVLEATTHPGQGRAIKLMQEEDYYDVLWTANTQERNRFMTPVPFPLLQGGLGLRGFVILRSRSAEFEKFASLDDLKPLIFCQGRGWPDAVILEAAELNVYQVSHFDAMLSMVELGRCDALPLSIYEGYSELAAVAENYPKLTFFTDIVIQYDLVMNFYVKKDNIELRNSLLNALSSLHEEGLYSGFMDSHELTKQTTKFWEERGHRIIFIPTVPNDTIQQQKRYFSDLVIMSK